MAGKDNKVFYGEYTLKHWIDLIVKKNIILPEYQRYFVWDIKKTECLLDSLNNKEFVPPVTIGAYNVDGELKNLIIDGQQRLTSILLAAMQYFPNKNYENFKPEKNNDFASDNDDFRDKEENENMIEWTFSSLIKERTSLEKIVDDIRNNHKEKYIKTDFNLPDLDNTYLGFNYLVPDTSKGNNSQQKYYSTVFRNINNQGQALTVQECRESLYYLNSDYKDFFHPSFVDKYNVNGSRLDFVKYISLLSEYKKFDCNPNGLARNYSRKMEEYYEKFITFIIESTPNEEEEKNKAEEGKKEIRFVSIKEIFGGNDYQNRLENLKRNIDGLNLKTKYESIIDMDMFFFGLIYWTLFEGKEINIDQSNEIKKKIGDQIDKYRNNNDYHMTNPGVFKYLRSRVNDSIEIYKEYIKNEQP